MSHPFKVTFIESTEVSINALSGTGVTKVNCIEKKRFEKGSVIYLKNEPSTSCGEVSFIGTDVDGDKPTHFFMNVPSKVLRVEKNT